MIDQIKAVSTNYTLNEKQRVDRICRIRIEIEDFNDIIAEISSENNANLIKQHFLNLTDKGGFSLPKMWKLKQKLNLKGSDPPMAKVDKNGQIITTKQGILNLYEAEYKERLAQTNPHKNYDEIQKLKEDLFELRFKIGSNRKTEDWSYGDLEKICQKLENNKARDRDGLIYELFKPKNCGSDLIQSMVKMFNQIKNKLIIPKFLQNMSITSIWKHKGSRSSLSNERGIFNLSRPRVVLDKLIYQDIYDTVDSNLSCSNAGGRRGRGIRDQLFIIQGIINEVINGKSKPICLQSMDVRRCFDNMNYFETNNDLWDTGVNDNKFSLLSQLDRTCKVVIKTPCGETREITFADLILQGSVFGSLKCSVQVDTLGREVLSDSEGMGVFTYKDSVEVPPICIVDDIIGISECNLKKIELNALINSKVESKTLELNQEKCFTY